MNIKYDAGRFYSGDDPGKPLAEITFTRRGDRRLVVDHTFTDPSLRGQGIRRKLVESVARYAREEGYKLLAACSYARKVLQEPEFDDVYAGGREEQP